MNKLKERWEVNKNWQLIFLLMGIVGLGYSSYKLSLVFLKDYHIGFIFLLSVIIFYILLRITLKIFDKLKDRWDVTYRWELISIFLVFAITGSSSVYVGKPIIKLLGITKDNLSGFAYWTLYIFIGFVFYQILLVIFGWIFGQHKFFWNFEKKMLRRLGFKRFLGE